jgi:hypothetical protein
VDVICEGYEYPDDPYILQGSCGLEYTLDYTKEGEARAKRSSSHDYYGSNSGGGGSSGGGWFGSGGNQQHDNREEKRHQIRAHYQVH